MELINQSLASDSPNDKPKNEAGCSYEDPNLGWLRRPIYQEQSSRDSIYLEDQHPDNQLSKSDLQVTNYCVFPFKLLSSSLLVQSSVALSDPPYKESHS